MMPGVHRYIIYVYNIYNIYIIYIYIYINILYIYIYIYIYIYRVSHFKLSTPIIFLFLNVQQNVSNKSCLTSKGTEDGGKNLTLDSHLKVT